MKKLLTLMAIVALVFAGCSTKYDTIPNKNVSVKVRSIWIDCDYDSRVVVPDELAPLDPLPDLEGPVIEPLETIE